MTTEILALIPARGGSKGVPGKNILEIAGKPLIAWTILQARASARITRVVVSTDDEEIAAVSRAWGAETPFLRPAELAQDLSPDIDAFRHALEWLGTTEGYRPELVAHLRATAPLRSVEDIDLAIDLLASRPDADCVRSIALARQTPYKMWCLDANGAMKPLLTLADLPDCQSQARQKLPVVYAQTPYVDVIRPRAILEKCSMTGDVVLPFLTDVVTLDLDYPEDLEPLADALAAMEAGGDLPREPSGRHSP